MRRNDLVVAALVAVAVVVTTVSLPALVAARPAYEIPVHHVADDEGLDTVDGAGWSDAPAVTVPLGSTGAAVPASDNTSIERVSVAVARTDERLYLRLSWADPTRDVSNDAVRAFADAVAVQLPVDTTARPPIAMGSPDNRVNVWYWSAAGSTQELLAGGPGTTTQFDDSTLQATAAHRDGRWRVVLSRPLAGASERRASIPTDRNLDVAFAVWDGSNMERSGRKAASEWYYLALGPEPEGPPYEAILWAVAGIAIVFTTLVTVEGVRRTRGE